MEMDPGMGLGYSNIECGQILHNRCHIFLSLSVAVGVRYFKAGEHSTAMKYFHHALEIDPENVEGLVARGAL